ncbi:MAG: hypothetical protein U1F43_07265 [Myxococcota bacterium]
MRRGLLISGLVLVLVGAGLLTSAFMVASGTGKLDLRFVDKPTLMTAAYKVYGNGEAVGGKYWLGKLTLTNTGDGPLRDVAVSFQVPGYVAWTTPESFPEVLPGQTVVVPYYPKLPATVAGITSMTPASVEARIAYDDGGGAKTRTESREFQFRGVHEIEYSSLPPSEILTFWDANDNAELNAAWVTEEDPVVRAFYSKASELTGGFGTMGNFKEIEQLARSTYNYMVALGMTYSGTKGLPEKKGDEYVLVQSMRLPRDIIYGNSGLCVELAQLWCSIAINAGAGCYLVMIPGHAFPVLRAGDGSLLPVEATGIGGAFEGGNLGAAASFEDAVKVASDNFQKAMQGQMPSIVVDVLEYRDEGIRPPELPDVDRTALVKSLDDRLREHQGARQQNQAPNGGGGQPQGGGQAAGGAAWQDPQGRMALAVPAGWVSQDKVVAQMRQVLPGYALSVVSPNTGWGVDVIFFDGVNDANQVVQTLVGVFQQLGAKVQVGQPQNNVLGGKQAVVFPFQMASQNGQAGGFLIVVGVPGGLVGVSVGGPPQNAQAATPEVQALLQSVRLAQ